MGPCDRGCSSPVAHRALLVTSCIASVGASIANYFVSSKTQDIALRIGEQCINKVFNSQLVNTTCAAFETTLTAYNKASYALLLFAPTVTIIVGGCAFMVSRNQQQQEILEARPLLEET